MAKTAFLGLGVMGFHMAGHLAARGHQVTVWNRSEAKRGDSQDMHGGSPSLSEPEETIDELA